MQYSNCHTITILFSDDNLVDKTTRKFFLYSTYIKLETNKNETRNEKESNIHESKAHRNYKSIVDRSTNSSKERMTYIL